MQDNTAIFFRNGQFFLVLVFYLLLGVANFPESVDEGINDLLLHFIGYCLAVFSAYLVVQNLTHMWKMLALLWLFSLVVEVIQHFLSWRSFSALDLMANGSGILAGFILVGLLHPLLDWLFACFKLSRANASPGT